MDSHWSHTGSTRLFEKDDLNHGEWGVGKGGCNFSTKLATLLPVRSDYRHPDPTGRRVLAWDPYLGDIRQG